MIALIGMAFRFPGDIDDPASFWELLHEGRDVIGELPEQRAARFPYLPDAFPRHGAYLDEVAGFDAGLFGMNGLEACYADPQQRQLLLCAWRAFEQGGLAGRLADERVGVYVGSHSADYLELAARIDAPISAFWNPGMNAAALANHISFSFDLNGPSVQLNTACSSSLEALVQAHGALKAGVCDLALVGGVNLILSPTVSLAALRGGMLSPDGRCFSFDHRANGFVRGEGVVCLVLSTLERAQREGFQVLACLRSAVSGHGGRAASFTAPNLSAQRDLLVRAIQEAAIEPNSLACVEAHGTGTRLGDPVEVEALSEALAAVGHRSVNHCGLTSVKTNLGHGEAVAGLAGVVKMVLAAQHHEIPPLAHFERLNPLIELDASPLFPVAVPHAWSPSEAAPVFRAGVSSFGFGGSYAHVILEEAPSKPVRDPVAGPWLFPFSARNDEALRRWVEAVLQLLADASLPLDGLAYGLQLGRFPLACRLAVVSEDSDSLRNQLRAFLDGAPSPHRGTVKFRRKLRNKDSAQDVIRARDLDACAALWVRGHALRFSALWPAVPRPISLPPYPFDLRDYWLDALERDS